ncbi:hypothetical protein [Streptomyces gibsoniae]|uniref:Uncharacterized protein n=1 Tax=Streptomyces gibsoniae TaxID=3075529 RepID=A0ABU2TPQ5_9ACTN|nr:hypothetical protein [Streptomyces sp. DSM 41699]MDT0462935.1 hypothetical protein [Streptomyces sp. DSM 41699]
MNSLDRYDHDPDALAWARAKIRRSVDRAERAAGNGSLSAEEREEWRRIASYVRGELLTRDDVAHAAFDERLPAFLGAIPVRHPEGDEDPEATLNTLSPAERLKSAGAVARIRAWIASEPVTADTGFGDGYREALRDIQVLIGPTPEEHPEQDHEEPAR